MHMWCVYSYALSLDVTRSSKDTSQVPTSLSQHFKYCPCASLAMVLQVSSLPSRGAPLTPVLGGYRAQLVAQGALPQAQSTQTLPAIWGATGALLVSSRKRQVGRMCQTNNNKLDANVGKVLAVVGLGNVGSQYVGTRHNIGFAALDALASKLLDDSGRWVFEDGLWESAYGGTLLRLKRGSPQPSRFSELVLFKPASMMNGSGGPVSQLMAGLNLPEAQLLVIYDDLDLEVGRLRLRKSGSAGGQNGVKSVLAHGFKSFLRVRLGISRPPKSAGRNGVVGHVLGRFRHEELDPDPGSLANDS